MHLVRSLTCAYAFLVLPFCVVGAALRRPEVPAPPACKRMTQVTPEETKARFDRFVDVFVGSQKNVTAAFMYIVADYINHNPMASNGIDSAWNILSPSWDYMPTTMIRSKAKDNMSWVGYRAAYLMDVVDRFRWEGGCIVEHWDFGENWPENI